MAKIFAICLLALGLVNAAPFPKNLRFENEQVLRIVPNTKVSSQFSVRNKFKGTIGDSSFHSPKFDDYPWFGLVD